MWVIIGLLIGIILGMWLPYQVPVSLSRYVSVGILAGLDSVVGGSRAGLEDRFDTVVFSSGFVVNTILAIAVTWVGVMLGADLYLAAVVTFGLRIFANLGAVRRHFLRRPASHPPTLS
ncbi:MAG: small basic family protein [Vulcanimicrobiota bacterium]